MNQPTPKDAGFARIAAELQQESEKLRRLAEDLQTREQEQQELLANYPHLQKAVHAWLAQQFQHELPPLPPEKDLKTIAQEEGAMPLEDFLNELENPSPGT